MFKALAEGFVSQREPGTATAVAAGPRCAVLTSGEVLCTFMAQSELGVNDFVPMLARSRDGGLSWTEPGPIFPELAATQSLFCSISRGHGEDLFLYGIATPIDQAGESFWSDATQGMKQNGLFWSRSTDGGHTWSAPAAIPMDGPGSAEAPGPLTVTARGRWIVPYAPYNTFDAATVVDRARVVVAYSDDQGATWAHTDCLRFAEADSGGAEAWVIELADGRLLTTAWHVDHNSKVDYPNAYAISEDGGSSWTATESTGILGQSTALTALPDGRALFIYNQRKHGPAGVWMALVNPRAGDFGVASNEPAWLAQTATQKGTAADHSAWTGFSFGEPSCVLLGDGTMLLVFWCVQPAGSGIRYVKIARDGVI